MKAAQMEEQQKFIERLVLIVVVTAIVALGGAALWYWADYLKDLSK
jgi:hypothetical protein